MNQKIQRLTAVALAFVLLFAPSTFADVSQLRADMERVFGKKQSASVPDQHEEILEAMNRERAAHGLGPLRLNAALSEAAGDGWMRSPGHRENSLQRGFDEVGIAIAAGAPQRGYKGPTVVAMYGRR